ncbi:MAG: alpha/beta hydrolase [Lewinellaceae bacterium]|nr:alpha/beta hydrolase [Phaeodactylibacter sp.]MCB9040749.1 alpha/beta hydrolase [Lewinellaceae bacterium]
MNHLDDWRRAGKTFNWNGHRIFYREAGRGEALLLLHGFPTASWDWHKVWPALEGQFHVIAPDFPGFGFSDKPRKYDYAIAQQADMVEELVGCLGIQGFHILAHDYGDTVAQELLARHNGREGGFGEALAIQSLCLLNGGLFPEAHAPRLVQHLMASPIGRFLTPFLSKRTLARNFRAIFGPETLPSPEEIDEFWSLITHNQGKKVMHLLIRYMAERRTFRERWVGALQQADLPIRLIDGAADPISGRHLGERYQQLIPDPDVVFMEGVGHYPQIEAPELVVQHFLKFREGSV